MRSARCRCAVPLFIAGVLAAGCGDGTTEPRSPVNQPPRIRAQADTSVAIGDTLRLRASATDPEGDRLTYRATVLMSMEEWVDGYRPNAGIDTLTGRFWFSGTERDMPAREFIFDVFDARGGRDSTGFSIAVY